MFPVESGQRLALLERFQQQHRTGILTLLLTDLVDSTRLKQELGDNRAVELVQQHHARVRLWLKEFRDAQEIETAGDSFLLVFARPSDAVRFALGLHVRNRQLTAEAKANIQDRIGIHAGEVFVHDQAGDAKLFGSQVDLCGRVASMAQGGQLLLTRFVFDNARAMLKGEDLSGVSQLSWVSHGPYLLKGFEEAVEVCEVAEAAHSPPSAPKTSEKAQRQVRPDEEPVLGWRPAVGQEVPNTKWVLEEKLGEGGFGEVWKARHAKLTEFRVFKFCFRADRVRSLKREVTLFRLLKERIGEHPNIVKLYDIYFDQPPFYLEEEYVEGKDLKSWCEAQGGIEKVPLETRLEIVAQAAEGLQAAHDSGIIHRDVKPGNILISGDLSGAKSLVVKLTDFGIGQVISNDYLAGMTRAGFTMTMMASGSSSQTGSQLYMAPELLAGKPASIRSDVYSLGVVLFQVLVGDLTRPVATDWADEISDPLLRDDLKHCFAGRPEDRFGGVADLARRLRTYEQRKADAEQRFQQEIERQQLKKQALVRRRVARLSFAVAGVLTLLLAGLGYGLRQVQAQRDRQRLFAYASDMRAADATLRENHLGQAVALLRRHIPSDGETDLRGIEWRYLWQRSQGDDFAAIGTRADWFDVSPDGRWLATKSLNSSAGNIEMWETSTRRLSTLIEGVPELFGSCLGFSPTGNWFASAGPKGLSIRKTTSWEVVRNLPCTNAVIKFSSDGATLVAVGADGAQVWDTRTWTCLNSTRQLKHKSSKSSAATLALSPDGTSMAAADSDILSVTLWSVPSLSPVHTFGEIDRPVSVALSDNGRWLAAGGFTGEIRVWETASHQLVAKLPSEEGPAGGLGFSPDGKLLATGGGSQVINLWLSGTTNLWATLKGHQKAISALRFAPDGASLISVGGDGVRFWNVPRSSAVDPSFRVPDGERFLGVSSNASVLFTINLTNRLLREWNIPGFRLIKASTIQGLSRLTLPNALVPDIDRGHLVGTDDGYVLIWSLDGGDTVYSKKVAECAVIPKRLSPDRRRLFLAERVRVRNGLEKEEHRGVLWNLEEDKTEGLFPGLEENTALAVSAFSLDGGWLLYATTNYEFVLWDIAAKAARRTFPHSWHLRSADFASDGRMVATCGWEHEARVWDFISGKLLLPPLAGHRAGLAGVFFSRDSKTLVTWSGDNTMSLWSVATGQQMVANGPINAHIYFATPISGDNSTILEAVDSARIQFIRLPTLKEIDAAEAREGKGLRER